jgi:hypothetical protein
MCFGWQAHGGVEQHSVELSVGEFQTLCSQFQDVAKTMENL